MQTTKFNFTINQGAYCAVEIILQQPDATHSYTSPGAYTATVTATDSNGSQGTSSEDITISERIIHYNAVINKAYVTNLYTQ